MKKYVFIMLGLLVPLAAARALTMEEIKAPQVKGNITYAPVFLTSPGNVSLKLSVAALKYENGKWQYQLDWSRTRKDLTGSLYVTLKTDKQIYSLKIDQAPPDGSESFWLEPLVRYRVEFYRQPEMQNGLLLRKFFNTLPAIKAPTPTPPPIAVCDYSPPKQGCDYQNGPDYNPVTQCGKIEVCPTPTPSPVPSLSPTPTQAPTGVTVLSPNGGENWQRGTTQKITWTGADKVDLYLFGPKPDCLGISTTTNSNFSLACGVMQPAPLKIASGVTGGSFEWNVNDSTLAGKNSLYLDNRQYKIQAVSYSPAFCTDSAPANCSFPSDYSDDWFTVSSNICPLYSCPAPPAGYSYVTDGQTCGCGVLQPLPAQ